MLQKEVCSLKTYRFNYNIQLAHDLRDAVNERQNLSIEKEHTQSNNNSKITYSAWDRICAIMDRLEDTISHINNLELGKINNRSAFDFYEFINCAYVIIDCIKTMGRIFGIDPKLIEDIEKSRDVFGDKYSPDGTDGLFFEYIRSLCVVHPLFTNRQKVYLSQAKFHCCPFVVWNKFLSMSEYQNSDLTAWVYTSKSGYSTFRIPLYVEQFEKYLEKWISFIPKVIEAKNNYADIIYEKFRNSPLKQIDEFSEVTEYLMYLKDEFCRRFGDDQEYVFDDFIRVFSIELSNPENENKLKKYKNAILYALRFLHNAMQNMSFEGYENTGIKYPDSCNEIDLVSELSYIPSYQSAFSEFSYNLSKVIYLGSSSSYSYYDKLYARDLLDEAKELINQYVCFTNRESDDEAIVLVQLAQYLEALTRKSSLNKNIPNEELYRDKLLSNLEYDELFVVDETVDEIDIEQELKDFEELLKNYKSDD